MIDLLLVEDEPFMRQSIIRSLELCKSIRMIQEASNGKEALELLQSNSFQILLTDIRMPLMDGISLIKQVVARSLPCACIVLSAHKDFSLVTDAFKAGACEYLLKSNMNQEDVEPVLLKAISRMQQNQNQLRLLRRSWLSHIARSESNPKIEEFTRFFPKIVSIHDNPYRVGVLLCKDNPEKIFKKFLDFIEEIFFLEDNRWGVLYEIGDERTIEGFVSSCSDRNDIWFSLGISYDNQWPLHFASALSESCNAAEYFFLNGKNRVFFSYKVPDKAEAHQVDLRYMKEKLNLFREVLRTRNWKCGAAIYNDYSLPEKKYHPDSFEHIRSYFHSLNDTIVIAYPELNDCDSLPEDLMRYGTLQNLNLWLYQIFNRIEKLQKKHPIIKDAIRIINRYPQAKVSQQEIALRLNLNASYFSRLFHKEMGIGFTAYVNKKRIELAVELIKKEHCKIHEAAELSGFSSPDHFCRVFKRLNGIPPSEYF